MNFYKQNLGVVEFFAFFAFSEFWEDNNIELEDCSCHLVHDTNYTRIFCDWTDGIKIDLSVDIKKIPTENDSRSI